MAGKPIEAMALIGLGFRSISMAPASVGPVKAMVLSVDAGELWRTACLEIHLFARGAEGLRGRERCADLTTSDQDLAFCGSAEACKALAFRLVCAESCRSQNGNFTAPGAGKLASGRWTKVLSLKVTKFR